ncbi:DUF4184 family protein [Nocardioides aurantiacus]|uniref:Uncharacterized protein DUF4184 n=1 Tax=Nocardioides aurantiacus TaxID=86796 RepID=A0A3N2CTV2_9ACTN|nr:uncharacterized protein DUF4184 [Nocardioides aurantiacus]
MGSLSPVPITLAHPAAVLPLRWLHLPLAAMVFGSMVPDVPLFMGWASGYALSHSLPGVITVNLMVALAGLCVWNAFVRDALVDMAPNPVRMRLAPRHRLTCRQWLVAPAAAVVGSLTHLAWDAFTHPGRWGVTHVAWLRADLGPLPGFKWAQYASGVIGMCVVLWAVLPTCAPVLPGCPCVAAQFLHRSYPSWSLLPGPTVWLRDYPDPPMASMPLFSTVSCKASSPHLRACSWRVEPGCCQRDDPKSALEPHSDARFSRISLSCDRRGAGHLALRSSALNGCIERSPCAAHPAR